MAEKKEITFEKAVSRLEEIVKKLELGEAPIDESLKMFEEAVSLSRYCNNILLKAEQKVMTLTENKDGNMTEVSFDEGESSK
jgi:exodeoxyribonuclease VII small subunit